MASFLIADKSKIVLEVLEFTLEQYDYQVFVANETKQLWDIYRQNDIDFVLLSLEFDSDGIQLAKQLLAYRPAKVLIMSNTQNLEQKKRAKDVGVVGWILKPFIPSHLVKHIVKTFLE